MNFADVARRTTGTIADGTRTGAEWAWNIRMVVGVLCLVCLWWTIHSIRHHQWLPLALAILLTIVFARATKVAHAVVHGAQKMENTAERVRDTTTAALGTMNAAETLVRQRTTTPA